MGPAFKDEEGMTPYWQVVVTPRRLCFHIHHAAVDGVGLAMIAGTLFVGFDLDQSIKAVLGAAASSKASAAANNPMTFWDRLSSVKSFLRHGNTPTEGMCCPKKPSPIGDPRGVADVKDIRYVHLGPYSVPDIKA